MYQRWGWGGPPDPILVLQIGCPGCVAWASTSPLTSSQEEDPGAWKGTPLVFPHSWIFVFGGFQDKMGNRQT